MRVQPLADVPGEIGQAVPQRVRLDQSVDLRAQFGKVTGGSGQRAAHHIDDANAAKRKIDGFGHASSPDSRLAAFVGRSISTMFGNFSIVD